MNKTSTVAKFATVQNEGSRPRERIIECYNLDAIISVGYRVNSIRGTKFRIWATQRLREYIIKGYNGRLPKSNIFLQLIRRGNRIISPFF